MLTVIAGALIFALIAVGALSILILSHELGHFLVAKKLGVYVEEFGLGLPPRLFGKKIGETLYSLNALPIGGFVRLHGETGDSEITDKKRAFVNKSKLARVAIAIAGVVSNLLFGVIIFVILFWITGIPREAKILEVGADSPAMAAGILEGDIVTSVNGKKILLSDEFPWRIDNNKGKQTAFEVRRQVEGKSVNESLMVDVRQVAPEDEGLIGVVFTANEVYFPPFIQRPFVNSYYGFRTATNWSERILIGLGSVGKSVSRGRAPEGVAGPVGIVALLGYIGQQGILPLLNFTALISINLAILNLVPFPPLDGSRILFVGVEAVFGKRVLPKIESYIHTAGMIILLALLLTVTGTEIPKIISAGSLSGFVETIIGQ